MKKNLIFLSGKYNIKQPCPKNMKSIWKRNKENNII